VAAARALAAGPKVILADEPTANLDSHTAQDLLTLLQDINREHNTTFVFSTHDPLIMRFAQRVIYLRDGHIEKSD
jgi:putative ABC transport system ATP-binding protein